MTAQDRTAETELKVALDNRAFEIQLFWQRSNYFLVLMTALGVATFSVKDAVFAPIIAAFSTAASYFWLRTNLGSKFWQESWEVEVVMLADEQKIRSFQRPMREVINQVEKSLKTHDDLSKKSPIRRWVDRRILKKYSVTYNMILLSLFAIFFWFSVTCVLTARSISQIIPAHSPPKATTTLVEKVKRPAMKALPVKNAAPAKLLSK